MVLLLSGFGLLMIYSATRFGLERAEQIPTGTMERQMIFVTAGLIARAMGLLAQRINDGLRNQVAVRSVRISPSLRPTARFIWAWGS